jgi:hypothetical protein
MEGLGPCLKTSPCLQIITRPAMPARRYPAYAYRQDAVIVSFARTPLRVYGASRPIAFELCDGTLVCHFADAEIIGAALQPDASAATDAGFMSYCRADAPICNPFNDAVRAADPVAKAMTTVEWRFIAGAPGKAPPRRRPLKRCRRVCHCRR